MQKPVTLVCLTRYKDVVKDFIESVNKYCPDFPIIFVRDPGGDIEPEYLAGQRSTILDGKNPFQMAGNCNIGWKAASKDSCILYCGDDIRFIEPNTVERLQEIAYKDPTIGILSPRLLGRSSKALAEPKNEIDYVKPLEFWFPCVYIKREVIEKVGYLDEQFNDFGSDDLDYCIRTQLAGYHLGATDRVTVCHEASPEGGPTTFVKKLGVDEYLKQQDAAFGKLQKKYNVSEQTFRNALRTGNTEFLVKSDVTPLTSSKEPTKEEAKKILQSRSIYLATPCYGGMMTVNYVNSLLGLSNLCRDVGVKFAVTFVYNESLITRARNKMVSEYLTKSDYTDFFFIDADIGFDPRDIVSLVLHDEPIIGSPCVRKNLRLDRVVDAVRKNPSKNYSIDELAKLLGEFVINFPPDAAPPAMNLGQMIEVQDVGTGIMRVRREVFQAIQEKYQDRWFIPMMGEGEEAVPQYMYFQSCIDEDSAKHNAGGYPHYIAEDYSFCRLARKAGLKVYLAPWLKTTHAGTYLFQGDLEVVAKNGGKLR